MGGQTGLDEAIAEGNVVVKTDQFVKREHHLERGCADIKKYDKYI